MRVIPIERYKPTVRDICKRRYVTFSKNKQHAFLFFFLATNCDIKFDRIVQNFSLSHFVLNITIGENVTVFCHYSCFLFSFARNDPQQQVHNRQQATAVLQQRCARTTYRKRPQQTTVNRSHQSPVSTLTKNNSSIILQQQTTAVHRKDHKQNWHLKNNSSTDSQRTTAMCRVHPTVVSVLTTNSKSISSRRARAVDSEHVDKKQQHYSAQRATKAVSSQQTCWRKKNSSTIYSGQQTTRAQFTGNMLKTTTAALRCRQQQFYRLHGDWNNSSTNAQQVNSSSQQTGSGGHPG